MKKLFLFFLIAMSAHTAHAQQVWQPWTYGTAVQNTTVTQQIPTTGADPCKNAQTGGNLSYCPLEPLYAGEVLDVNNADFASILNNVFRILISFGALFAVAMLVIGGIQYMTSTAIGTKATGLERAKAALLGILILAGSFVILNTINPQLTFISLNPGAISGTQSPGGSTNTQTQSTSNYQQSLQRQSDQCRTQTGGTFVVTGTNQDGTPSGSCYPAL